MQEPDPQIDNSDNGQAPVAAQVCNLLLAGSHARGATPAGEASERYIRELLRQEQGMAAYAALNLRNTTGKLLGGKPSLSAIGIDHLLEQVATMMLDLHETE